jgi:hypothetical protein
VGVEHDPHEVRIARLVEVQQALGERAAHLDQPRTQPRQPGALGPQLALHPRQLGALGVQRRLQLLLARGEAADVGL